MDVDLTEVRAGSTDVEGSPSQYTFVLEGVDLTLIVETLNSYSKKVRNRALVAISALAKRMRSQLVYSSPDLVWASREREDLFNIDYMMFADGALAVSHIDTDERPAGSLSGVYLVKASSGYLYLTAPPASDLKGPRNVEEDRNANTPADVLATLNRSSHTLTFSRVSRESDMRRWVDAARRRLAYWGSREFLEEFEEDFQVARQNMHKPNDNFTVLIVLKGGGEGCFVVNRRLLRVHFPKT